MATKRWRRRKFQFLGAVDAIGQSERIAGKPLGEIRLD
jgi:hypothetical protein